ncbi:MAG: signal recognition particle-docking protein FtsY [Candidatus Pacearchaeota archaeon]
MFGKLKEKLKSWTKKFSESKEEVVEAKPPIKKETKKEKTKTYAEGLVEKALKENLEKEESITETRENKFDSDIKSFSLGRVGGKEPEKSEGLFSRLTSKITKVKISEEEFDVYGEELEMLLLENNVALEVAEKIIKELKEKVIGQELLKKEIESEITDSFKDILRNILVAAFLLEDKRKEKDSSEPYVILFCGINGTGKTTTIAKIAEYLKKKKLSSVLAAADTFRAASIEQIKKHGEKLGIKVIAHDYGTDPAAVGFDAIKYAKKNRIDFVLIDTAGRMHTSKNLMTEIEKIAKVCKPDLKIFVGESITGNDIIEQVKTFDWHIGVDGIILAKADIDEKGGTALSVGYITKKPILFLGTGQEYDAIEAFDKEKFIQKLGL